MTINQLMPDAGSLYTGMVTIDGYIGIDDDAAVLSDDSYFRGATVTHSGTGQYTIVLNESYFKILTVQCNFQATGTPAVMAVPGHPAEGAKHNTVIIRTVNSSGNPADTNISGALNVTIRAKLSSVNKW